jgi:hypothetical protein
MDEQNMIYTDYCWVLKGNKILAHAMTTWIDLTNMLSEISQAQKNMILYDSTYMRNLE